MKDSSTVTKKEQKRVVLTCARCGEKMVSTPQIYTEDCRECPRCHIGVVVN